MGTEGGARGAVWRAGSLAVGFIGGACAMLGLGGPSSSVQPVYRPTRDVHAEYIKYASGTDSITAYLAYPERADPAPAVLVIHEIFGISDFVRSATEDLAKNGFVALAPDLLTRRGGTPASPDSARRLIASLNPDTITRDLNGAFAYLQSLKAVRASTIGVIGFCWGGGESFRYATNNPDLRAFVVCYGPAPKLADVGRIRAHGYGVYADRDVRINQELFNLASALHDDHVQYHLKVYPGVSHGFLRTRDHPKQADEAWKAIFQFLHEEMGR